MANETTAKHKPGPWTALPPAKWAGDEWVVPGVAHCGNGELSEANARLIAAAPDLLEAVRALADQLRKRECSIKDCKVLDQADAALSKVQP